MRWRTSLTILLGTGWLVFILLFAAFWSGPPMSLFQDIVIFFASIVLVAGGVVAIWASWGMRFAGTNWEHWR